MSIKLSKFEGCPYADKCPFNNGYGDNQCRGAIYSRDSEFVCDLVTEEGKFKNMNEGFRSSHDETGKMKIIME